jgi:hypothetical protein
LEGEAHCRDDCERKESADHVVQGYRGAGVQGFRGFSGSRVQEWCGSESFVVPPR